MVHGLELLLITSVKDDNMSKIIWQTHECLYEELPELYKSNSKTWIENFPDWEYRYSSSKDRDSFIEEFYPEYINLYRFIGPGIYRADFWRYLVIYEFGGLYADMDSIYNPVWVNPNRVLDFNKDINVSINVDAGYQNAWIFAKPKNPVIKKVIESMIEGCQNFYDQGGVSNSMWVRATGPDMYTKVINDNIDLVHLAAFPVEHAGKYKHESDIMV